MRQLIDENARPTLGGIDFYFSPDYKGWITEDPYFLYDCCCVLLDEIDRLNGVVDTETDYVPG